MGALTISFIGFSAILILAFLRFPLALSMGLVGVIGFGELTNYRATPAALAHGCVLPGAHRLMFLYWRVTTS